MNKTKITPEIQKTLILTGIATVGTMVAISWHHRCARNSMILAHELIMNEISFQKHCKDNV